MLMRTAFGEFVRTHRSGRGWRLRDVADRSGLSVAYLSEVERGRKEPSSDVVAALCDALDVPLSVALRDVGQRLASDARRTAVEARRAASADRRRLHVVTALPDEPRRVEVVTTGRARATDATLLAA